MEHFLKKVITGQVDEDTHRYFLRFGKGNYKRRFLISYQKTGKLKLKGSFELANDFVNFVNENMDAKFTGVVLCKEQIPGKTGKKKAGTYVYEVSDGKIDDFNNVYFYLLNCVEGCKLRIKRALPKPGKDADKIDDAFCLLEIGLEHWPKLKETFFWDASEGKKVQIEHELQIDDIILPEGETNPVKIRELAKRKGKLVRKINCDDSEQVKEYPIEA